MSDFFNRTEKANALVEELKLSFWSKLEEVVHFEYGYETHIDTEVQSTLRHRRSKTAKHIRFAPDFLVYNKKDPLNDYLFEYKVTLTPRYSFREKQWNYGQIEADALDNYIDLRKVGVNVITIVYCPYHSIPLLFGVPKDEWKIGGRKTPKNSQGSGTDFYNIDLSLLFDFKNNINELLSIDKSLVEELLGSQFYKNLLSNSLLQTEHAKNSPYNSPEYATGFNWFSSLL